MTAIPASPSTASPSPHPILLPVVRRTLVASKVEEPAGRHEYETGYSWPATVTTSATAQGSFAVVAPTQADPRAKRLVPTELLRAWRSAATARRNLGARR